MRISEGDEITDIARNTKLELAFLLQYEEGLRGCAVHEETKKGLSSCHV